MKKTLILLILIIVGMWGFSQTAKINSADYQGDPLTNIQRSIAIRNGIVNSQENPAVCQFGRMVDSNFIILQAAFYIRKGWSIGATTEPEAADIRPTMFQVETGKGRHTRRVPISVSTDGSLVVDHYQMGKGKWIETNYYKDTVKFSMTFPKVSEYLGDAVLIISYQVCKQDSCQNPGEIRFELSKLLK